MGGGSRCESHLLVSCGALTHQVWGGKVGSCYRHPPSCFCCGPPLPPPHTHKHMPPSPAVATAAAAEKSLAASVLLLLRTPPPHSLHILITLLPQTRGCCCCFPSPPPFHTAPSLGLGGQQAEPSALVPREAVRRAVCCHCGGVQDPFPALHGPTEPRGGGECAGVEEGSYLYLCMVGRSYSCVGEGIYPVLAFFFTLL